MLDPQNLPYYWEFAPFDQYFLIPSAHPNSPHKPLATTILLFL